MITALIRLLTWLPSCCRREKQWTKIIIDWHNYGWTILQVNRASGWMVKVARAFELTFGRFADYHLTVSEAMKQNLGQIVPAIARKPIHVLYDRATDKFKPTSLHEKRELYSKINLDN